MSQRTRIWANKKALTAQIALIALIFNAVGQVQCCVGAFADDMADDMQAIVLQTGGLASHCHDDDQGPQSEKIAESLNYLANLEVMANAMDHGAAVAPAGRGHGDHSSGGCDCTDGVCGQGLVALASLHEGAVFGATTSDTSDPKVAPGVAGYQYREFSARAPPHTHS